MPRPMGPHTSKVTAWWRMNDACHQHLLECCMHLFCHLNHSADLWKRIVTQHHHSKIMLWARTWNPCLGGAWCRGWSMLSLLAMLHVFHWKKFQFVAWAFLPWFEVPQTLFLELSKPEKRNSNLECNEKIIPFERLLKHLALFKIITISYCLLN